MFLLFLLKFDNSIFSLLIFLIFISWLVLDFKKSISSSILSKLFFSDFIDLIFSLDLKKSSSSSFFSFPSNFKKSTFSFFSSFSLIFKISFFFFSFFNSSFIFSLDLKKSILWLFFKSLIKTKSLVNLFSIILLLFTL